MLDLLGSLEASELEIGNLGDVLHALETSGSVKYVPFDASRIDLLPRAATLRPEKTQAPQNRRVTENPQLMFPAGVGPGAHAIAPVRPGETREYDRYVAGGLSSGKFEAVEHAKAGGGVFCIGKASGDRLRAIWNGSDLSSRTAPPPMPPGLMTPETLGRMEFSHRPVMSKRDGQVLFDQLRVPDALVPYLAAPPTTLRRLAKAGADPQLLAILRSSGLRRDKKCFPCSRVWPMGFSWASWAAQSHTLALKNSSLIPVSASLAQDMAAPAGEASACGVATDDIILLSGGSQAEALLDVKSLDEACDLFGMGRRREKDVNLASDGVAVGLALLHGGSKWGAPATTVWKIWRQVAALLLTAQTTPRSVQIVIGSISWLNLLQRLLFCLLYRVYGFTSLPGEDVTRPLPDRVKAELLRCALLVFFWNRSTTASWYPLIAFTDASTTGLGGVAAPLPAHVLQALARVSFGPSEQLILDRPHEPVRSRTKGSRSWILLVPRSGMRVVLKEQRSDGDHINVAESRAVIRWLQRVVRDPTSWGGKLFVLVDSRATLGAFSKGRSSSWSVNRILQQALSLCLPARISLHLAYTPSEFNIGDLPSRGRTILQGSRRTWNARAFDRMGIIHDLGTHRQRGPPLQRWLNVDPSGTAVPPAC